MKQTSSNLYTYFRTKFIVLKVTCTESLSLTTRLIERGGGGRKTNESRR